MYSVAVITVSDKCSAGLRADASGDLIAETAARQGFTPVSRATVPDEFGEIAAAIRSAADQNANLILTTGGTGFSKRDITPEATASVLERQAPGIAEALRAYSMKITPRAMLSRAIAGIIKNSIVVNLPGSPKAVREELEFLLPNIGHGIDILVGSASECARKD